MGGRSFSFHAPFLCNQLPVYTGETDNISICKIRFKTLLFDESGLDVMTPNCSLVMLQSAQTAGDFPWCTDPFFSTPSFHHPHNLLLLAIKFCLLSHVCVLSPFHQAVLFFSLTGPGRCLAAFPPMLALPEVILPVKREFSLPTITKCLLIGDFMIIFPLTFFMCLLPCCIKQDDVVSRRYINKTV